LKEREFHASLNFSASSDSDDGEKRLSSTYSSLSDSSLLSEKEDISRASSFLSTDAVDDGDDDDDGDKYSSTPSLPDEALLLSLSSSDEDESHHIVGGDEVFVGSSGVRYA
jgi:hypothetical protein